MAWVAADIAEDDLVSRFAGAYAVVHPAWAIQPTHNEAAMARTSLLGSHGVFEAAAAAGVGAIVYASPVGAYSPGPKDRTVDESWPTNGIADAIGACTIPVPANDGTRRRRAVLARAPPADADGLARHGPAIADPVEGAR